MSELIRLQSGDWIKPEDIRSIKPLPIMCGYSDDLHVPRLVVTYGMNSCTVVELALDADPFRAADELAAQIKASL